MVEVMEIKQQDSATREESKPPSRIASIDVYRGLVMFLMLAELLHLMNLATEFPDSPFIGLYEWIRFSTTHVEWVGCSLHDLIQPGFSFLVGVALPFSLASRVRKGESVTKMSVHALGRAILLILLGVFLRSLGKPQTNWTFEDTLTQIGLGYFFLFLIGLAPRWFHYAAAIGILVGYWGLFAASAPPPADFDYAAVSVAADWPHHEEDFTSRWNKNSNIAWQFDRWFMNLFPRESEFVANRGGYSTLSFIPTLATMLMGLIAGGWLRLWSKEGTNVTPRLAIGAAICLAAGLGIAEMGWCPLVKRIWTPTFALWSGGWCFLFLLGFHLLCDRLKFTGWAFPLLVIGSNSILIYVMSWTLEEPIRAALTRHLGSRLFEVAGAEFSQFFYGAATLVVMWLMLFYLYRKKIFLRI